MSLMPRINFPINFYFWEGSSPSSKETKGKKEEGRRWRERGEEGDRTEEGEGGRQRGGLGLPSPSKGHLVPPCRPAFPAAQYGLSVCIPLKLMC